MNGLARRLVLTQRQNATREWPIYFMLAELCFVVGRVISYQFLEMLMKLLNCVRLFRNFPYWVYASSMFTVNSD